VLACGSQTIPERGVVSSREPFKFWLTEVLWCASTRRQHLIPTESVRVGDASVSPVTAVRDLGVYIDADVTMRTHVTNAIRACFAALHQISSVRRALPQHALLTLVRALVITKLDQCNSILMGASGYLQDRLQSMLNAVRPSVCPSSYAGSRKQRYPIAQGLQFSDTKNLDEGEIGSNWRFSTNISLYLWNGAK